MLPWIREANGVISATKGLTETDLDHLFDTNANTIGALLLHLAATETYYQMNTFDGMKWDSWSAAVKENGTPPWTSATPAAPPLRATRATSTSTSSRRSAKRPWQNSESAMTHGSSPSTRLSLGAHQQLLQVVPRLRARSPPRRPDRASPQTPPRRQAGLRVAGRWQPRSELSTDSIGVSHDRPRNFLEAQHG